jgi:hypothetical protein
MYVISDFITLRFINSCDFIFNVCSFNFKIVACKEIMNVFELNRFKESRNLTL